MTAANCFRSVILVACLGAFWSAWGGPSCNVPGDHVDLNDAVGDVLCASINLGAGRYDAVEIGRSLALIGAGSSLSIIEGSPTTPALSIVGDGIVVELHGLRLEAGNGSETVLETRGGASIAAGSDLQVGPGNSLFNDGFEAIPR